MKSELSVGRPGTSRVLRGMVCVLGVLLASDAGAVTLSVSSASGGPGDTVEICVDLATEGDEVAGVQADLVWNPACAEIDAASCRAGDHDKPLHKSQRSKSRLRAIVLALDNVDPIPDGSRLFCCDFRLLDNPDSGDCRVTLQNVSSSDSVGNPSRTGSYAGAILPRGGLSASADTSSPLGGEMEAAPIEDKVVTGGAGSQEAVVAVGAEAPPDEPAEAGEVPARGAARAPEQPAPGVEEELPPPVAREEAQRGEVARVVDVEQPAGPGSEETQTAVTEKPTPERTKEETKETPRATLTSGRATATTAVVPTRTAAGKAAAKEEKRDGDSACQIVAGSSDFGVILLLVSGMLLGGLRRMVSRRRHWRR